MRKNGFSAPLDWIQIASWGFFVLFTVSFYAIYLPFTFSKFMQMFSIPYTLIMLLIVYWAFKATISNPADLLLINKGRTRQKNSKICTVCLSPVADTSKHCSRCDKCISGFDHHCRILNNCIGSANYSYFFKLILALEVYLLMQLISAVYSLCFFEEFKGRIAIEVLVGLECFCAGLIVVANAGLIGLHCWLRRKKLTTYEYILNRYYKKSSVVPSPEGGNKGELYLADQPIRRERSGLNGSLEQLTNM